MKMLIGQVVIETKLFMRDRQVVFWTFFFPIFLILLFGFVFTKSDSFKINIGLVDEDETQRSRELISALEQVSVLSLERGTREQVLSQIQAHQRNAAIVISRGYGDSLGTGSAHVEVQFDPSNIQIAQAVISIVRQVVGQVSWKLLDLKPPIDVVPTAVQDVQREIRYIEFLVPGLIGVSLVSTCLFSIGVVVASYREKGKLRRLSVTPLPKPIFIAGQIINRYTIVLLQAFLLIGLGILVFSVQMQGNVLSFILLLTVGMLAFLALGFLIASTAKTAQTASGIANVIFIPMMFLSGVYFPVDGLPKIFKPLVEFLPLTHFVRATRAIFNDGASLDSVLPQVGILSVWMVVCFALSVRLFRWE